MSDIDYFVQSSGGVHAFIMSNYMFCYLSAMQEKNRIYGCSTVIVGSSYTMFGIEQRELIGGNAENINFSMSSQDIYYDYMNLCKAVNDGARHIDKAIIALGYYALYQDESKQIHQNWVIPAIYSRYLGNDKIHNYAGPMDYDPLRAIGYDHNTYTASEVYNVLKQKSDSFFMKHSTVYGPLLARQNDNEFGLNGIIWSTLPDEAKDKAGHRMAGLHNKLHKYTSTMEENVGLLFEMTDFLHQNGIRPIYIVMPFSESYKRHLMPEYKAELELVMRQLPGEIYYFDMNETELFDDDDFIDTDHLNIDGAHKATNLLRKYLEEIDDNV